MTDTGLKLRSGNYVQGNILAGFNKPHQVFLFLGFGEGEQAQANAKAWLAELTRPSANRITTTRQVMEFRDKRCQRKGEDPRDHNDVWLNVGLTYAGLVTLAPELAPDLDRYEAFRSGPAGDRAALLGDTGDSAPENWLVGKPGAEPHALLTIAADDRNELRVRVAEEREVAERVGLNLLRQENGQALANGKEHFGFKDGVSQPGIRGFTRSVVRRGRLEDAKHAGSPIIASGEFVLGRLPERRGDGAVPLPAPVWMWGGSFQVFRRLIQDVPLWNQEMARLGPPSLTQEQLAAKAVGRHPDGKPLGLGGQLGDNDFDYEGDDLGHDTPRFAHIRKMNPRNHRVFGERARRILRRGITFGPPYDAADPAGDGNPVERGLLFNAFMASIEEQFEFLQRQWANNTAFPSVLLDPPGKGEDGVDPVVGTATAPCLLRVKGYGDRRLDFKRFVRTTGAVYAFAPSLLTLRGLATEGEAAARFLAASQWLGYPAPTRPVA
jgi:Dyp-type peroxidase family